MNILDVSKPSKNNFGSAERKKRIKSRFVPEKLESSTDMRIFGKYLNGEKE